MADKYNLGVPASSLTNTMGTPGIAGVTPGAQNNTITPEKYKKTFFQTAGGIALTGGLGALIGMGQRHIQKLNRAKQLEEQGMQNLMNMELAPESQQAYQQSQALAGQGLDEASRAMAVQENARMMNMGLRAAGSRRSALAALAGFNSNDFATRLASQNAMMRRDNMMQAIQTGMQFGNQKTALQQAKNEALINKGTAERSRLNQTLSSVISGGAQIGAALLGKPPGV